MNFFKVLDKLKAKKMALIIYCLLDRIPLIVLGNDSNIIDEFLIELSELVHFRKEIVFFIESFGQIDAKDIFLGIASV